MILISSVEQSSYFVSLHLQNQNVELHKGGTFNQKRQSIQTSSTAALHTQLISLTLRKHTSLLSC